MKNTLLALLLFVATSGFGQSQEVERLTRQLASARQDTSRVLLMAQLCDQYRLSNPDLAMSYGQKGLMLSRQLKYYRGEALVLSSVGAVLRETGNLPKALEISLQAYKIAEKYHYQRGLCLCLSTIANIYFDLRDYPKSIYYNKRCEKIAEDTHDELRITTLLMSTGAAYAYAGQLDSAMLYLQPAYVNMIRLKHARLYPYVFRLLGLVQEKLGNNQRALAYYHQSVQAALQNNDHRNAAFNCNLIAAFYLKANQPDSCVAYARQALAQAQAGPFTLRILNAVELLAAAYKQKEDFRQAFAYEELMLQTKERLFGAGNIQAMQTIIANEEKRQREAELAKEAYQTQIRQVVLLGGLGGLLVIAYILYRYSRQQQKANAILQKTLSDLHTTQTQLIQKEKMASLGELTAGIAHEIQNPLNFVNNFSEVSVELIEELDQSVDAGNLSLTKELATDLRENLQRITQNGQRASNIVRGMLEHSRTSTGERQPTDLNALCDEYFRLAYQGIRSKDPSFTCQLETDLDASLPPVSVVASDISRVLLNLFNNAFYAVNQKAKTVGQLASANQEADYQPTVSVSTTQANGCVEIRVRDNGSGIPSSIQAKIFQPFFTTKPTGEGTGLGLSLSYDIVTKGHGGVMSVESEEGEETTFIVKLPIQTS